MTTPTPNAITFYGAPWCPDCRTSKKFLDEHSVEYEYIDLAEHEEAAEIVEKLNNGLQSIPTIVFKDGSVLTEPSNEELAKKLGIN